VSRKVGKFVALLPHTPYVAVGLNFHFQVTPERLTMEAFTRGLFFSPRNPLHNFFDAPDAQFGGYASRDVMDCRLKLEVKPGFGQLINEDKPKHFVLMAFNFHTDLEKDEKPVERIGSAIARWDEANRLAHEIAQTVVEKE